MKATLHQIDLVRLRRNSTRQIKAPKEPLVDDLPDFRALPSFTNLYALKLEELFVRKEIYEGPTLEVLKEELTIRRLKQEALKDKMEDIVANQEEIKSQIIEVRAKQESMEAKHTEMSLDIKTILQLLTKKPYETLVI